MAQENVETVRRAYAGVRARLEPPGSCSTRNTSSTRGTSRRISAFCGDLTPRQEAFLSYWETFEKFHVEDEEVIHADQAQVITRVRDGGRMKGSDAEVWNRFFHVWTFRDGKVLSLSIHTDKNRALEAAGLSE